MLDSIKTTSTMASQEDMFAGKSTQDSEMSKFVYFLFSRNDLLVVVSYSSYFVIMARLIGHFIEIHCPRKGIFY